MVHLPGGSNEEAATKCLVFYVIAFVCYVVFEFNIIFVFYVVLV